MGRRRSPDEQPQAAAEPAAPVPPQPRTGAADGEGWHAPASRAEQVIAGGRELHGGYDGRAAYESYGGYGAAEHYDDRLDDHMFGGDDIDDHGPHDYDTVIGDHHPRRRRRGRGVIAVIAFVIVIALVGGGVVLVRSLFSGMGAKDYAGQGTGSVSIVVNAGDTLTDIADTLQKADVVASAAAFISAAKGNPDATSIQPGTYAMRSQMSGKAALALILTPDAKQVITVTIPEGYRIDQVEQLLSDKLGAQLADVKAAAADFAALGIPAAFGAVTSAEGFLYPATYDFQPGTTPAVALKTMVGTFVQKITETGFVAKANALGVSPYEALEVASMAQAEATNDADWAKVARVIYNRAAAGTPLGIDSTSVYEARLAGTDPMDIDYQVPTPYNTRVDVGFPPTPIGSPGDSTLAAAVAPATGDWLYYVQTDAAGTLTFTADYNQFTQLAQACTANGWGNC